MSISNVTPGGKKIEDKKTSEANIHWHKIHITDIKKFTDINNNQFYKLPKILPCQSVDSLCQAYDFPVPLSLPTEIGFMY
jgi:hypothetical protein